MYIKTGLGFGVMDAYGGLDFEFVLLRQSSCFKCCVIRTQIRAAQFGAHIGLYGQDDRWGKLYLSVFYRGGFDILKVIINPQFFVLVIYVRHDGAV